MGRSGWGNRSGGARRATRVAAEMSEDQKRRLSKQAGLSIRDRPLCLSGKGKMETEGQVLTSWPPPLSLPPSASFSVVSEGFFFCGSCQGWLSLMGSGRGGGVVVACFISFSGIPKYRKGERRAGTCC